MVGFGSFRYLARSPLPPPCSSGPTDMSPGWGMGQIQDCATRWPPGSDHHDATRYGQSREVAKPSPDLWDRCAELTEGDRGALLETRHIEGHGEVRDHGW